MKRVILHWTAGRNRASASDRKHYHYLVNADGNVVQGAHPVSANAAPVRGAYAAHTLNCNTDSIGVSLAGMAGAVEFPFSAGKSPITEVQWNAAAKLVADLCRQYRIAVRADTVLSHAEVQGTLGIKQRGKWDISRLPWDSSVIGAKACGERFRSLVRAALGDAPPPARSFPTLREGARGAAVLDLQAALSGAGMALAIDGDFGPATKRAVIAFQRSKGLEPDGIVGPMTWTALF